jgi:hypothetical protein
VHPLFRNALSFKPLVRNLILLLSLYGFNGLTSTLPDTAYKPQNVNISLASTENVISDSSVNNNCDVVPLKGESSLIMRKDKNLLVIEDHDNIIISSGGAIHLLPGTKIDAEGKFIVKVRPSLRKQKKLKESGSSGIVLNPKFKDNRNTLSVHHFLFPLPEPSSLIESIQHLQGVVPARTRFSKIHDNTIISLFSVNFRYKVTFLPSALSAVVLTKARWGESSETISIMRT